MKFACRRPERRSAIQPCKASDCRSRRANCTHVSTLPRRDRSGRSCYPGNRRNHCLRPSCSLALWRRWLQCRQRPNSRSCRSTDRACRLRRPPRDRTVGSRRPRTGTLRWACHRNRRRLQRSRTSLWPQAQCCMSPTCRRRRIECLGRNFQAPQGTAWLHDPRIPHRQVMHRHLERSRRRRQERQHRSSPLRAPCSRQRIRHQCRSRRPGARCSRQRIGHQRCPRRPQRNSGGDLHTLESHTRRLQTPPARGATIAATACLHFPLGSWSCRISPAQLRQSNSLLELDTEMLGRGGFAVQPATGRHLRRHVLVELRDARSLRRKHGFERSRSSRSPNDSSSSKLVTRETDALSRRAIARLRRASRLSLLDASQLQNEAHRDGTRHRAAALQNDRTGGSASAAAGASERGPLPEATSGRVRSCTRSGPR